MLVRDSSSRKKVAVVLLMTFSVLANAQTYVSKLLPSPELLTPALQPGTLAQDPAAQDPAANVALHIEILNGDRGINIIKKKTAVKPVVEVRDRNNLPVAGAAVIFSSPSDGPSVVFLNGSRSITVITDSVGRATTTGLKPLNPGNFHIDVSASFHSQSAKTSIAMTNALTAAAAEAAAAAGGTVATGAGAGGLSTGVIVALVAVAAGVAVGVGVGLGHHSSSATTTPATSVTIGVGSGGTVGSPHLKHGLNLRF
jgi:hypothetical protein